MLHNYITLSLETHLFFSRIMKEHALFLEAGFPCKDRNRIRKADVFRQQFEKLLEDVIRISDGRISFHILESDELVTEFTIPAEHHTERLSGIPINTELSRREMNLRAREGRENSREMMRLVDRINQRALILLDDFIDFKKSILREVESCRLFTFNYPLLIQHILREAMLYRSSVENLMQDEQISYRGLWGTEEFWNQIMMEHALFIRGLLDPSEETLIETANEFSQDYKRLLEMTKQRDYESMQMMTSASLTETLKYRDFKTAGTKGILDCEISSIILPLLADHVLREANHYIRILQCALTEEG